MNTPTPENLSRHDQAALLAHLEVLLNRPQTDVPWDEVLWAPEQIAEYLHVSHRTVTERYAVQPGFPQSVRPGGGHPRWYAKEIAAWVRKQRPARRV